MQEILFLQYVDINSLVLVEKFLKSVFAGCLSGLFGVCRTGWLLIKNPLNTLRVYWGQV